MLNLGQVLVNHNVEKWKLQDLKKLTIIIKFVFLVKHIFSRLLIMSSFLLENRRKPIRSNHYPSLASVRYFREDKIIYESRRGGEEDQKEYRAKF